MVGRVGSSSVATRAETLRGTIKELHALRDQAKKLDLGMRWLLKRLEQGGYRDVARLVDTPQRQASDVASSLDRTVGAVVRMFRNLQRR